MSPVFRSPQGRMPAKWALARYPRRRSLHRPRPRLPQPNLAGSGFRVERLIGVAFAENTNVYWSSILRGIAAACL